MASQTTLFDSMLDLVARTCAVDTATLSSDTLLDDIGLDSLSLTQIMENLERAFTIELHDEDLSGLAEARSIGEFVGVLNDALQRQGVPG